MDEQDFVKVGITIHVEGQQVASQVTRIKKSKNTDLPDETVASLLRLSCINSITGMVIPKIEHVARKVNGG